MLYRYIFFFFIFVSCSVEHPSGNQVEYSSNEWGAKDLFAGPVEIIKSPFAVITCPLRLTGKEIDQLSISYDGAGSVVGQSFLIPFRAVIDGAFTGVGYLVGGAVDTVSGGTLGVVSNVSGHEEPNDVLECALSGTSE